MRIALGLPEPLLAQTSARLAASKPDAQIVGWEEAGDGSVLLVAPHEYEPSHLEMVLAGTAWTWVHLTSAGVDFIDLAEWPAATLLTRSWRCYAAPLAEYVLAAVITHEWGRETPWTSSDTARGGLWGARVGVAGWGAVGRRVAEVAAALGASVRVMSRTPRADSGSISHTTRLDDLRDVDHLVIALPFDSSTQDMFDRRFLAAARPGMHLINVSRAGIVDQERLCELCAEGQLSATLDVAEPDPLPPNHPLRQIPSVRYSPHTAWSSRDSQYAFLEDFLAAAAALERGEVEIPGRVGRSGDARALASLQHPTSGAGRL